MDRAAQAEHWRQGAEEDLEVAIDLISRGRARHGLFFAHLALEKVLKAHFCMTVGDIPPRLHNLVRLAERAGLELSEDRLDVLAEMNAFSLVGRYPEMLEPAPASQEAAAYLDRAKEVYSWLLTTL
jgi:HEPN domain-containing protein